TERGWPFGRWGVRAELARVAPAWAEPARGVSPAGGMGRDGVLDSRPPDVDVTPSVGRRGRRDLRGRSTSMREPALGRSLAPALRE
ncbi:hypothetical protein, partial [Frankia sp. AgKG'84/4]|uniref:hypothetical protein n=1 Tax=Frankia sp. AgKG'84/4 TaxID=573490 RepID=UPI00202A6724